MPEQTPFSDVTLATNTEPRCPCVLLLDVSGSMQGNPISELNSGLMLFKDELAADSLASKRVELTIVTFGDEVKVAQDFITPDLFSPPVLVANGPTPMGEAITKGLDLLETRKIEYNSHGINSYRPWVFLITDGGPTDPWQSVADRVKDGENKKKFSFFAVGVEGANMDILGQISVKKPLTLKGVRFRDLFSWLSRSLKSVSSSRVGDSVPLSNPAAPEGWASI